MNIKIIKFLYTVPKTKSWKGPLGAYVDFTLTIPM